MERAHPARRRHEGFGVLGIDPALNRMAVEHDVLLRVAERVAGGDADLLAHQVHAADHLGDRMLHLQAGVHLDEGELLVLIQELQRAGIAVAELGEAGGGDGAERVALRAGQYRGTGLLQQFLVPALQGAVALAEMHHVAVRVGHDLQLDMARAVQVFLDIHRVVAEAGPGLGAGDAPCLLDLVRALGHLHAAAAAAGGSLDQHRIADPCGDRARLVQVRHHTVRARHQRYAERGHGGLGLDLVAHHADMRRRGADEGHAVRLDLFGEAGVLRQEAIAGVDGVRPGDGGSRQDVGNVEIGIFRRRRADADAFIGQAHMHCLGVGG